MSAPPSLRVDLVPSRVQQAVAVIVALGVALTTLTWPWGPLAIALGNVVCVLSAIASIRRIREVAAVVVIGMDGPVVMVSRSGEEHRGRLVEGTYVCAPVVSLVWRPEGARCSRAVLITPDMLARDAFRQLCVIL